MVVDLWLPPGVTHLSPSLGGHNVVTGSRIVIHTFRFHSAKHGKSRIVKIPADDSVSRAQIEDMAANALETWYSDLDAQAQRKVGKHTPSREERLEVGKALREFRAYAAKRRESSNQKVYYALPKIRG